MIGAVVIDKIGRIGGEEGRPFAVHQALHVGGVGTIAAQKTMAAQAPQVAALADRLNRRFGNLVFFGGFAIGIVAAGTGQQPVEFAVVEAGQGEIIVGGLQFLQFEAQQILVPIRPGGGTVHQQAQRLDLSLGQIIGQDHRDFGEAEFAGGLDPQMAVDDQPAGKSDDRNTEPELDNGRAHLIDGMIVLARIAGIVLEPVNRPKLDSDMGHGRMSG